MEEKKTRQSTIQAEQVQGFNSLAEDELNLTDLLKLIVRKKVLILAVTSFCTLFSIFYAQSITPIYRVTIGFLAPRDPLSFSSAFKLLPKEIAKKIATNPYTIFDRFLVTIQSHKFKQEVFVNGGFQKKFFRDTGIDTNQSVSEIYDSTTVQGGVSLPRNGGKDALIKSKRDGGFYVELKGSYQPKVMLEFLKTLVEAAKEKVNTEIQNIASSLLSKQIQELQQNIENQESHLLYQTQELQQNIENQKIAVQEQIEIVRLSRALDIAKRMGIKDNNFDKPDNGSAPDWFRYGELALEQEIKSFKSKKEETPEQLKLKKLQQGIRSLKLKKLQQGIKSLNSKKVKIKLERLQTVDVSLLKFKVVTIGAYNHAIAKPNQFRIIVGSGIAFGLFISIFMAFLIEQKQLGAKETPFSST